MDFFEAMNKLKSGEKVRIVSWKPNQYIGLVEVNAKWFGKDKATYQIVNELGIELNPMISFPALVASEWEVFDESLGKKIVQKLGELFSN